MILCNNAQVLDRHLSDLGTSTASGLFTKSLEVRGASVFEVTRAACMRDLSALDGNWIVQEALLAGASSFAVHSLKDMPTALPTGLVLGGICKRESPEDAAIIHPKHKANGITSLSGLPEGSVIGTSSLRREALLRSQYPTFEIKTIRGNIQTRLAKLDEHDDYDAIIVAACGFRRGGLGDRIDEVRLQSRACKLWIDLQTDGTFETHATAPPAQLVRLRRWPGQHRHRVPRGRHRGRHCAHRGRHQRLVCLIGIVCD